jgi:hypothetical protein
MNKKQQRLLIILGFIILSLMIVGIMVLIFNASQQNTSTEPNQNEFVDPATGQTILNPDGKSPENYGTNPDTPVFVGFSNLLRFGARQGTVDNTKSFLNDYANQRIANDEERITEISIVVASIQHTIDSSANTSTYTFEIIVNRGQNYNVRVTMQGVSSMTASLFSSDSKDPLLQKTYDL